MIRTLKRYAYPAKSIAVWPAILLVTGLIGLIQACDSSNASLTERKAAHDDAIASRIYHSGGVFSGTELCPESAWDTITPIDSLNPPPKDSEPEMTVKGMQQFIKDKGIKSVDEFLTYLPAHFRNNFSLVEKTISAGSASLEYPRIILFGSDGHFMMDLPTDPNDHHYTHIPVMQLDTQTGHWEFSQFDFSEEQPVLRRNLAKCRTCHGDANARPMWGTFWEWEGIFGDSVVAGPRPEAMHHTHAIKMNDIMRGEGGSTRFDILKWRKTQMRRGGARMLAEHDFGPELVISNIVMGSATALGTYLRLSHHDDYQAQRHEMLLAYYLHRVEKQTRYVKADNSKARFEYARDTNLAISQQLATQAAPALDPMLLRMGIDTSEAFSLATIHGQDEPKPDWSMGASDLYDMLMLQVLDELRRDDPIVAEILATTALEQPLYLCPDTVQNVDEMIDLKMLHLFHLKGEARYQVHWVYYPRDLDDIYEQVFLPIADSLIPYLQSKQPLAVAMQ